MATDESILLELLTKFSTDKIRLHVVLARLKEPARRALQDAIQGINAQQRGKLEEERKEEKVATKIVQANVKKLKPENKDEDEEEDKDDTTDKTADNAEDKEKDKEKKEKDKAADDGGDDDDDDVQVYICDVEDDVRNRQHTLQFS